jgi:hypothetical protein
MYKLTHFNSIVRVEDGACIPMDEENRDYREYLEWVKAGGVPAPVDQTFVSAEAAVATTEQTKNLEASIERWKNG